MRAAVAALASAIWIATFAQGPATAPAAGDAAQVAAAGTSPGGAAQAPAAASSDTPTGRPAPNSLLPTQAERDRFEHLAKELRCLVCQNQTLADSQADLAADLRHEVETMMLDGRSDDEIKAFLVQRYGDFVLYKPPVQSNTWLLWAGPFGLLVVGAVVWWRIQRRARPQADVDLERARRLLDEASAAPHARAPADRV